MTGVRTPATTPGPVVVILVVPADDFAAQGRFRVAAPRSNAENPSVVDSSRQRRRAGTVASAVLLLMAAAALVVGALPGAGGVSPSAATTAETQPSEVTITINGGGFAWTFDPASAEVAPDGMITVVNASGTSHTFTSQAYDTSGTHKAFDVTLSPGDSTTIPASTLQQGVYHYFCRFHPAMQGTLTVGTGPDLSGAPSFDQPLYEPPVLTGKRLRIVMKKAAVQVFKDGPATTMWTYGGTYPGPTIKRPTGADTKVTFVNNLPKAVGSVTVHQHAGHQTSANDGQPMSNLIKHGGAKTYDYPLRDGGKPLPAALRFYHDHRMDETARNNWMGLQGMFLTTDPNDAKRGLPTGRYEIPLSFTDRSFTDTHQLTDPFAGAGSAAHATSAMGSMTMAGATGPSGTVGDTVLVNGRFAPYKDVQPGLYRLRLFNASLFSAYDFKLSNGEQFEQVGTGSGLLPHPVTRSDILLGPAQRADVVVDFRDDAGTDIVLQSIARPDGKESGSYPAFPMQFRVGSGPSPTQKNLSDNLVPLPKLSIPKKTAMTWKFGLSTDSRGHQFWSINGRRYNPKRVDHKVTRGKVQKWRLVNTSAMTHYVHLHEELWRTISRDGGRPPLWERGYEDTWRLDPGESVVVAARFTDYTGKFMIHCHMLDHEDNGMMATFEVVKPKRR